MSLPPQLTKNASSSLAASLTRTSRSAPPLPDLLKQIKSSDDRVRTKAWQDAGRLGAPAVSPLAELTRHSDREVARAAKRGLWRIVRHTGRPGADRERRAVIPELVKILRANYPDTFRRDVLWMLSEIAGAESVNVIAAFLTNHTLREDAKAVLQRIPGQKSLKALESALLMAPKDFKLSLAQSLRQRGRAVPGLPCEKLKPVKKTDLKPLPKTSS